MRILLIAFLLAFLPLSAKAQPFEGISILAAHSNKFQCRRALRTIRHFEAPAIQTLFGTFGNSMKCVKRFTDQHKDKPHNVAINMGNGSCRRFNRCYRGDWLRHMSVQRFERANRRMRPAHRNRVHRRVLNIRHRIEQASNEQTVITLFPELEDNLSNRAYRNLVAAIREVWPYEIYRNSYRRFGIGGGDGVEFHGVLNGDLRAAHIGKCSWSNDGNDIISGPNSYTEAQMLNRIGTARANNCRIYLWRASWQGWNPYKFKRPRSRDFEFRKSDIFLIRNLLE
jgi:hypothetical protein